MEGLEGAELGVAPDALGLVEFPGLEFTGVKGGSGLEHSVVDSSAAA